MKQKLEYMAPSVEALEALPPLSLLVTSSVRGSFEEDPDDPEWSDGGGL